MNAALGSRGASGAGRLGTDGSGGRGKAAADCILHPRCRACRGWRVGARRIVQGQGLGGRRAARSIAAGASPSSSPKSSKKTVEEFLTASLDESDDASKASKASTSASTSGGVETSESEAAEVPPQSSPTRRRTPRSGKKTSRSRESMTGHWALRGLNEVESTAMGVEIRMHTVKAAIVDARTGNFLSRGVSVKLEPECSEEELQKALRRLKREFAWDGPVGCSVTLAVARKLGVEGTSFTTVGSEVGKILKKFLPRDPLVTMVHTEAAGYAELSFDNKLKQYLEEDELVLVCTIGKNLGAVLYNGGHRMRNIGLNRAITKSFGQNLGKLETKNKDLWIKVSNATHPLPPLPGMGVQSNKSYSIWPQQSSWPRIGAAANTEEELKEQKEESWHEWCRLVDSYLIQLSDYVKPTAIILMPTGAYTAAPLVEAMLPNLKVQAESISKPNVIPVSSAVGALVKGAAVGALVELKVQEAIATLRQAVGQDIVQLSKLSEEQLRSAFDYFDENGDGIVTEEKLKNDLQTLGSSLSPEVIERKLSSIKHAVPGEVTFLEFRTWWNASFTESPVTFITSKAEFTDILDQSTDILLQIGFSFCRPCKRFEPKFEEYAEENKGVRFVRMNGNENEDTIQFCKEDLQVRKTPSFFVFKNGKKVLSWTGANEEVFKSNLQKILGTRGTSKRL